MIKIAKQKEKISYLKLEFNSLNKNFSILNNKFNELNKNFNILSNEYNELNKNFNSIKNKRNFIFSKIIILWILNKVTLFKDFFNENIPKINLNKFNELENFLNDFIESFLGLLQPLYQLNEKNEFLYFISVVFTTQVFFSIYEKLVNKKNNINSYFKFFMRSLLYPSFVMILILYFVIFNKTVSIIFSIIISIIYSLIFTFFHKRKVLKKSLIQFFIIFIISILLNILLISIIKKVTNFENIVISVSLIGLIPFISLFYFIELIINSLSNIIISFFSLCNKKLKNLIF